LVPTPASATAATRGFFLVMAAQFCSSLGDNALLIAAISLLGEMHAPQWMTPMLKLFFFISYVLLAAFVGALADSMPKWRVMLVTNGVKLLGALLMLVGTHPLLAYAVVGFGAAGYSPAKYGIVTEMLPPERLVAANGWIEGLTVASIILGFVTGGVLISPSVSAILLAVNVPYIEPHHVGNVGEAAIAVICAIYAVAAVINIWVPDTGVRYPRQEHTVWRLLRDFGHCMVTLWKDPLGQISLAVTTLFWGAGATLQFILLRWSADVLGMDLSHGAVLQALAAVGIAVGAVLAAARVSLKQSLSVLPVGVAMGLTVTLMSLLDLTPLTHSGPILYGHTVSWALLVSAVAMVLIGAMAGYFVVPMNALLQHRGYVLLSSGHSIAVQNFNENLGILVMLGVYALLIVAGLSATATMCLFGMFVAATMGLVILKHAANQRRFDAVAQIGEARRRRGPDDQRGPLAR
jgi:LPLT family lysophospholipid transporter-like MFS transporter